MELLDRYLQAVGFWLPKAQRQDIIAELSEDLRSQVEERSELGRELEEQELEQLLKRRGAPLLVAERYLPQRHLIGPRLYPIYRMVLRSAVKYYLAPWLLVWIGFQVFNPGHRAAGPGAAIVETLKNLWLMTVYGFAFTTAAFAILERYQANSRFLESWDPRRLPPVRNPNQMSRGNQAAELTWNLVVVLWWVGLLRLPELPGFRIKLAPAIVHGFYWPVLAVLVALTAAASVNIARPWWTARRAAIRFVIDGAGFILLVFLLMAGTWVEVTPQTAQGIAGWLNWTVLVFLAIFALSFLLRAIQDLRRTLGKEPIRHWAVKLLIGE